jgi:hypothetical protein
MQDIEQDRSAIEEDIKAEQILQKEIEDLAREAAVLEAERDRRLAPLKGQPPSHGTNP